MKFSVTPLVMALALVIPFFSVLAQPAENNSKTETPLQGRAWKSANQAYKLYDSHKYERAAILAQDAIRLRPDVLRLRLLLVFSLQKQGKIAEALKAIESATQAGLHSPELADALKNLQAAPSGSSATQTAAYRKGFPLAQNAYAQYQDKKYLESERNAEAAFRADPTQADWALLWIGALEAQEKYQAAIEASDTAIALGAPNKSDLLGRRQTMQRMMAIPYAEKSYLSDDPVDAVKLAREAVSIAPSVTGHRLLLITVLMRNGQFNEAEEAATQALKQDEEDTSALVLRAYLRQLQGHTGEANADFDVALKQDWLDADNLKYIRLIAADASVVAGDNNRIKELLSPLEIDGAVNKRLKLAETALKPNMAPTQIEYPAPLQDCRDTPYGTVCDLIPADSQGNTPSAKAYAAYGRQDYQEAIKNAREAVAQEPDSQSMQRLLTTTLAAGTLSQQQDALVRLNKDLSDHPEDAELLMQRAYLQLNLKNPALALGDIRAARATGKASPNSIVSEGFAQSAVGDRSGAVVTLKSAIDMADAGTLKLTEEERWNARSGISGLSREWGATVALGYRGARSPGAIGGTPIVVQGDSVFSTAELYWRPWNFLNSTTRTFEVYGRLTNTLHNGSGKTVAQTISDPCNPGASIAVNEASNGGIAGFPTTIGALGMRFTPDSTWGVTFGLERQFMLGSSTRRGTFTPRDSSNRCALQNSNIDSRYSTNTGDGGWLTYVSYGYYFGTERKLKEASWWTVDAYAQAGWAWQNMRADFTGINRNTGATTFSGSGRYKRDQGFASAEMRMGRSYRWDAISDRLVIFPHAVVGIDWLKTNDRVSGVTGLPGLAGSSLSNDSSWAGSAGLGVGARYWFREDRYHAPRSYLDWTMQYRINVGGGQADRVKGLYMNLTLSY